MIYYSCEGETEERKEVRPLGGKKKSPKELRDLAVGILAGLIVSGIWELIKLLAQLITR